jgi:hypothetical protein
MRFALCGYQRGDGRLPVASPAIEVSDSGQVGQLPEAHLHQSGPSCQVRPPRWYPECDERRPRSCNSRKGKTPRERKISYSLQHNELRDFRASRAHRIPARFVQHGARVEGCSGLRQTLGFMIYECSTGAVAWTHYAKRSQFAQECEV